MQNNNFYIKKKKKINLSRHKRRTQRKIIISPPAHFHPTSTNHLQEHSQPKPKTKKHRERAKTGQKQVLKRNKRRRRRRDKWRDREGGVVLQRTIGWKNGFRSSLDWEFFYMLGQSIEMEKGRKAGGKERKGEMRKMGEKVEERRQIPDEKISPPRTKPKQ